VRAQHLDRPRAPGIVGIVDRQTGRGRDSGSGGPLKRCTQVAIGGPYRDRKLLQHVVHVDREPVCDRSRACRRGRTLFDRAVDAGPSRRIAASIRDLRRRPRTTEASSSAAGAAASRAATTPRPQRQAEQLRVESRAGERRGQVGRGAEEVDRELPDVAQIAVDLRAIGAARWDGCGRRARAAGPPDRRRGSTAAARGRLLELEHRRHSLREVRGLARVRPALNSLAATSVGFGRRLRQQPPSPDERPEME
jgi:hypothetical protein